MRTQQQYIFSSSLQDLTIIDYEITKIALPPNLRRLYISTFPDPIDFISEKMVDLEYLRLELPGIKSFEDTEIVASNLKMLDLRECPKLINFDGIK